MDFSELNYKDCPPEQTVARIRACLDSIGIPVRHQLRPNGIGQCCSAHVEVPHVYPLFSNGKGVSPELANASAHAEFIERLQCGLFLYKFQSIGRDKEMDLHSYAPDGKYMTLQELVENGDWMDPIIETYGHGLTRQKLAQQCKMYACAEEDRVLTLPFYSLFEDRYVYLPAAFVEHIYPANGCCAGNTREEAWVHAFSEMMERNATIRMLTSGEAAPRIPDEVLRQYPTPAKILDAIEENGSYDIAIFDFSDGCGYPVIGVRLINKQTQSYLVNTAADPVFEIALSRGLTEIFQGQRLDNLLSQHGGSILTGNEKLPVAHNILNQIETGNGQFALNFFTEECSCTRKPTVFDDNRGRSNKELLRYALDLFRKMGRPVYVRNYSFLGFPSYMFVIPGFSEARGMRLIEPVQEYAMGDVAAAVLRRPMDANKMDLSLLLLYFNRIQTVFSRRQNLANLAGLPIEGSCTTPILYATLAYAALRLGNRKECHKYLAALTSLRSEQHPELSDGLWQQLRCFRHYLTLKDQGAEDAQIRCLLGKLFRKEITEGLYARLEQKRTPLEVLLLHCDGAACDSCPWRSHCTYREVKACIRAAGQVYSSFHNGQAREEFAL